MSSVARWWESDVGFRANDDLEENPPMDNKIFIRGKTERTRKNVGCERQLRISLTRLRRQAPALLERGGRE
jgi:hypothetical protein